MIFGVIEQLNANKFCLTPSPHVRMCPLLLDPPSPTLGTSFMNDP